MRYLASKALGALVNILGAREVMLLSGLALVAYGAASVYGPAGFFLPGVVLLYCAIAGLR